MFSKPTPIKSVKLIHRHDNLTEAHPIEANYTYVLDVLYKNGNNEKEVMSATAAERKFGKSIIQQAVTEYKLEHPENLSFATRSVL